MEKFNKIAKNVLLFLVIFLVINYIFNSCTKKDEENAGEAQGTIVFETTDNEYTRTGMVTLKIKNNTAEKIILKNECPNEPFTVSKYENNDWIIKTASPELDCTNTADQTLEPGKEIKVAYSSWKHALFFEEGRYKIETNLTIGTEEKKFTTNEFLIVKEGIFTQVWNALLYKPIYNCLIFLTTILPYHSLGWAIIILTILIRTILLIPNHKAMMAQKKLQDLQPRLEKIKEKYKGDQQKISTETLALWKEAKVNPLGSCLPILLQFPFLIAVFYVIRDGLNPDNTWLMYTQYESFSIKDIDVNFLGLLDLTKVNLYVLPLIIGALQFVQMKLSLPKNKAKSSEMAISANMMLYFMPVMIAIFTASLPAGVGLYWGMSTIYGTAQQYFINKMKPKKEETEVKVKVIEDNNKKNN